MKMKRCQNVERVPCRYKAQWYFRDNFNLLLTPRSHGTCCNYDKSKPRFPQNEHKINLAEGIVFSRCGPPSCAELQFEPL